MELSAWEVSGLLLGLLCVLTGTTWWTVAAFQRGIGWGFGCLFLLIPVGVIFAVREWRLARVGVGLTVAGLVLLMPGAVAASKKWPEILDLAHEVERDLFSGF